MFVGGHFTPVSVWLLDFLFSCTSLDFRLANPSCQKDLDGVPLLPELADMAQAGKLERETSYQFLKGIDHMLSVGAGRCLDDYVPPTDCILRAVKPGEKRLQHPREGPSVSRAILLPHFH